MVTYNCYCHTEDWTVLYPSPFMQFDFTAVWHCVVATTSVPCMVWVYLRFCHSVAVPLKLLLQHGTFVCAVTVAFDAWCQHLSLCTHIRYSMSCCVLYCLLFTPVALKSTTITCTQVWSGSCERSCQKQEHYRVPTGALDTCPTGSWWYTSTSHCRWEEEGQSWTR